MPTSRLVNKKKKKIIWVLLHSNEVIRNTVVFWSFLQIAEHTAIPGTVSPPTFKRLLTFKKLFSPDLTESARAWLLVPKTNRSKFPRKHALWEDMGFTPAGWVIWEPKEDMTVREDTWQVPELQLREAFHKTGQFIKSSQVLPAHSVSWGSYRVHRW